MSGEQLPEMTPGGRAGVTMVRKELEQLKQEIMALEGGRYASTHGAANDRVVQPTPPALPAIQQQRRKPSYSLPRSDPSPSASPVPPARSDSPAEGTLTEGFLHRLRQQGLPISELFNVSDGALTDLMCRQLGYDSLQAQKLKVYVKRAATANSRELLPSNPHQQHLLGELAGLAKQAQDLQLQLTALQQVHENLRAAVTERGVPEDFLCPITREMMIDPVVIADGHTYERNAIEEWLVRKHTSPMTNQELVYEAIIPNHALRRQIFAWKEWVEKVLPLLGGNALLEAALFEFNQRIEQAKRSAEDTTDRKSVV